MKLPIILFAIVGFACGESVQVKNVYGLHDDLMDFMKLVPVQELREILLNYGNHDEELNAAVTFILSDEFRELVVAVDTKPQFKELLDYLQAAGLDAYGFINNIHEAMGVDPLVPKSLSAGTRTVSQMLDDMKALLPMVAIKALLNEKLETSPEFKALHDKLGSEQFHVFVNNVRHMPEMQKLVGRLLDFGVEVDRIVDFITSMFGWTR